MGRHIHADLIHKWAEGTEIQFEDSCGKWITIDSPRWTSYIKYRVKPKTYRYRLYLYKRFYEETPSLSCLTDSACSKEKDVERLEEFVKWLSDWIEVTDE